MTQDTLIVEPRLLTGSNFTAYTNAGSDTVIQGRLIGIKIGVTNSVGSLSIFEEGPFGNTSVNTIVLVSGTAAAGTFFPVYSRTSSTNTALWSGGNIYTPYIVNGNLFVVGSGFTSGTTQYLSGVQIILER